MGFCSKGLKNEFETAMVNEPSVLEPLKFYCIYILYYTQTLCIMGVTHMYKISFYVRNCKWWHEFDRCCQGRLLYFILISKADQSGDSFNKFGPFTLKFFPAFIQSFSRHIFHAPYAE